MKELMNLDNWHYCYYHAIVLLYNTFLSFLYLYPHAIY